MQFNKYSLYSWDAGMQKIPSTDFVDGCIEELIKLDEYDDVKEFITSKFGNIDYEKMVEFPDLKKQVYLIVDNEKIEFYAIKNEQQYYSKGWKLINQD